MPQPGPQFQALPQPGALPALPMPADAPEGAPAGEAQPGVSLQVSLVPHPLTFPDIKIPTIAGAFPSHLSNTSTDWENPAG